MPLNTIKSINETLILLRHCC